MLMLLGAWIRHITNLCLVLFRPLQRYVIKGRANLIEARSENHTTLCVKVQRWEISFLSKRLLVFLVSESLGRTMKTKKASHILIE
jgi:hypothetical protein